jgi:2-keto-3-deoxy-L-rhamnonate aldolase RhmA
MNLIEKKMVEILTEMRDQFGVTSLKAEFEAEASRINELMRLKEIADNCQVGLLIKIGGPEDISHIFDALHIGVTALNAPMVETPFAASKYFKCLHKYVQEEDLQNIDISINIETITAHKNLDGILNHKDAGILNSITVGRVDLTDSMGLTRNDINSEVVYKICEDVFSKSKKRGLQTGLGGGISTDAIDFIRRLGRAGLIDRYETRKIIFTNFNESPEDINRGILKAVEFETLWLENKRNYYRTIACEDDTRIEMLNKRLKKEISNSDNAC